MPHLPQAQQHVDLRVSFVTTIDLVRAVAGEHHLHVACGQLGDREQRDRRSVDQRLVEMPDDLLEQIGRRFIKAGVIHAQHTENILLNVIVKAHAGNVCYHQTG